MRIHFLALSAALTVSSFLRPVGCEASDPAVVLSESAEWLRLGHYEKKLLGGYTSRVVNEQFFLSPEGRSSPLQELRATIEAFRSHRQKIDGRLKQSAACAFPARRAWLLKQGVSLPELNESCPDRDAWSSGIGAAGATLVFSSAYPNNPASMFGHTLLMLNHASGEPILNYGANFEARVDPSDSSLLYGLKGLLGYYPGEYSLAPYYTKINEYNYSESRDIWEYELNLSPAEVTVLVNHLWELFSQGGFRYYFLDDNCSFHLMTLLEVVRPDWNLTTGYGPYTLPLDTVRKVAAYPGSIRSEKVRPSLYRKMNEGFAALSSEQKKLREKVLKSEQPADQVADIAVLESVITELDYLRRKSAGKLELKNEKLFVASLLRRTKLGEARSQAEESSLQKQSEAKIVAEESPLKSHRSHLLVPGFLSRGGHPRLTLGGRVSLHDNLDPSPGYSDGFSIDFARLRVSLGLENNDRKFRLDEFQLIDILSLYPLNSIDSQISWVLRAGTASRTDFGQVDSLGTLIEGGPGVAASLSGKNLWVYSLGVLYGEHLANAPKHGRFGAGGEAGLKAKVSEAFQLKLTSRYKFELNRPWNRAGFFEHAAQAALTLGQNWQARFGTRNAGSNSLWEWTGELRWYF